MYYSLLGFPSFRIVALFSSSKRDNTWPDLTYHVNENSFLLINRIDFVSYDTKEAQR